MNIEEFDRAVAINQRAPFFLCQQFAARLSDQEEDACIVNIASVNALIANPRLVAYAATKGALLAMTRGLALEFAPRIRVVAISPAAVKTHVTEQLIQAGEIDPVEILRPYLIHRFTSVEEIAGLTAFLFGPFAKSVTGANWIIDGGLTAT
jgi:NAD(P)-dependent dehydrogenase (short-subunit alcohol dehydrogenase family)